MRTIGSALVSIALLFFAACGGDDHQVPSPNASNLSGEEASISFCLQLQSGGTDQSNANLVDLGSTWENRIKLFRNGRMIRFLLWPGDGIESGVGVRIDNWQPGQWHAVTVTFGPYPETGQNLAAMYIDGSLVGQTMYKTPIEIPQGEPLHIGSNMPDGALKSFQACNRVLGPDEVASFAVSCPE